MMDAKFDEFLQGLYTDPHAFRVTKLHGNASSIYGLLSLITTGSHHGQIPAWYMHCDSWDK